jgi:surfeit locus 1 family protein
MLTPFLMNDGHTLLVDRGYFPMEMLGSGVLRAGDLNGQRAIVGIVREPEAPGWFTPPVETQKRIVHTRDPATLAKAFGLKNIYPMFLEADATPNPGGWPKGGVTVVDLPNNHLQYAITWFGLALGLLGVYLAYHASRGRLGLR